MQLVLAIAAAAAVAAAAAAAVVVAEMLATATTKVLQNSGEEECLPDECGGSTNGASSSSCSFQKRCPKPFQLSSLLVPFFARAARKAPLSHNIAQWPCHRMTPPEGAHWIYCGMEYSMALAVSERCV